MYILNIVSVTKKDGTQITRILYLLKLYYQQMELARENSYYSMKHQKKKVYNFLQEN